MNPQKRLMLNLLDFSGLSVLAIICFAERTLDQSSHDSSKSSRLENTAEIKNTAAMRSSSTRASRSVANTYDCENRLMQLSLEESALKKKAFERGSPKDLFALGGIPAPKFAETAMKYFDALKPQGSDVVMSCHDAGCEASTLVKEPTDAMWFASIQKNVEFRARTYFSVEMDAMEVQDAATGERLHKFVMWFPPPSQDHWKEALDAVRRRKQSSTQSTEQ